jgi:tetratricopeptide (TPR) repeat protein
MAREIGVSHTTVSTAFSSPRLPRWGMLELVVETLGGDTEQFHQLWLDCTRTGTGPSDADGAEPPTSVPPTPAPRTEPGPTHPSPWIPHELPADQGPFVGRDFELAQLDAVLASTRGDRAPGPSSIAVLTGSAGAGKTTTAVHWAHRVAERFPDGQIYLNLRGYDPQRPVTAQTALGAVLGRLGIDQTAIPAEQDERAALFRTVAAGRRLLILLDNVHTADQVRDLLPGTPSCFVLITSRDSLAGLVSRSGATRVELDRLTTEEATDLLVSLVGSRAEADAPATATLVERCVRLPLALRIAADVVVSEPGVALSELVAEFTGGRRRLDLLAAGGDEYTAVRSVFSWSLAHLSEAAVELFAICGLSVARDLDRSALTALAGRSGDRDGEELVRAHLLERRGNRYTMHDLLREYAVEVAAARPGLTDEVLRAARRRLFAHYTDAAATSVDATRAGAAEAGVWLERERPNLLACATSAAAEAPTYTLSLAHTLATYLDDRGYYQESVALHRTAVASARTGADRVALATALTDLARALRRTGPVNDAETVAAEGLAIYRELDDAKGSADVLVGLAVIHVRDGRNEQGQAEAREALALYARIDDRPGQARALNALGIGRLQTGDLAGAEQDYVHALEHYRATGDRIGEGRIHNNIGVIQLRRREYAAAQESFDQSLEIARANGNRAGVGVALANAADIAERQGRYADAVANYEEVLRVYEDLGRGAAWADATRGLGVALARLGRFDDAIARLHDAIDLGRSGHDADAEVASLNDLGMVLKLAGQPDFAVMHAEALRRSEQTGDRFQQARARVGLGDDCADRGDADGASKHWQAALAVFAELDVPEASDVRERLDR